MSNEPFSNREIKEMFSDMCSKLDRIEAQTNRTNGRVSSLEIWRGGMVGGMAVLSVIVVPLLGWALYTLSSFDGKVEASTQSALLKALSNYEIKVN